MDISETGGADGLDGVPVEVAALEEPRPRTAKCSLRCPPHQSRGCDVLDEPKAAARTKDAPQFGEHGLLSFRVDDNAELLKHPLDRITVSKH